MCCGLIINNSATQCLGSFCNSETVCSDTSPVTTTGAKLIRKVLSVVLVEEQFAHCICAHSLAAFKQRLQPSSTPLASDVLSCKVLFSYPQNFRIKSAYMGLQPSQSQADISVPSYVNIFGQVAFHWFIHIPLKP